MTTIKSINPFDDIVFSILSPKSLLYFTLHNIIIVCLDFSKKLICFFLLFDDDKSQRKNKKNKMSDLHEVMMNEDWKGLFANILIRYIADGWTEDEVDEIIVLEQDANEEYRFVMGDEEYIQDELPECVADSLVSHRQNLPDDAVVCAVFKHNNDETSDFGCITVKKEFIKNSIRKLLE